MIAYSDPVFYGSLARRALENGCSDRIYDADIETPDFKVTIDGAEASIESLVHRGMYNDGRWGGNAYANRYAEYFHTDFGLIQIDNPNPVEDKDVLIVGDSYTNCMERFLACEFATTYVLDPRHDSRSIDEFLEEHKGISDVVFIMRSTNFLSDRTREALS
ncbi:hypothetical protein VJ923_09045 [Adlercreutzia sp. R25]|uniref:hypothetical protein n=1 Tax=Adlercreutzia shanghongiae TaxID=3111773 RepID=UPI002DBB614F|nr:hypothetical protein [Adlercreutzia sp. R25]MEC4273302.1 hypothetical protein [Adlercreutzia sp. R25]